jgi:hypothetical protein
MSNHVIHVKSCNENRSPTTHMRFVSLYIDGAWNKKVEILSAAAAPKGLVGYH